MKRIMILGASNFQLPAIQKAKEMGLIVGVVDMNPSAIGVSYADEFFCVSTIDEDGVLDATRKFKADGIITLCTDMPMRALAYTCEKLGLNGLSYESAVKSTDKHRMITAFEQAGVEHPQYIVLRKGNKLDDNSVQYPVVSKPIDNSGSRGIMLVNNNEELKKAISYSSKNGRNGDIIIEEYMQGPEVSVELMIIDGMPHVLQITDKLTSGAPHFVEIGHSEPSKLPEDWKEEIKDLACRAAKAVEIKNGAGHAEIIYTKDGPKMVEIGARMGGGCIATHLVPLSTGIDMTKATIDVALGKIPNIEKNICKASAIRFLLPTEGIVKSIDGVDLARNIPGVKEIYIDCTVGQKLSELENGTSRIGHIIAQADTPEIALNICEKAISLIHIEL